MVRILNVEDTEASRYVTTSILRRAGFEVIEAGTGMDALRLAVQNPPDLVLLDINLPDIDGYEVCRRLKAGATTSFIPVIHLSASRVDSEDAVLGLEGGANAYLVQPIDPKVLVATTRALLRTSQAEAETRTLHMRLRTIMNTTTAVIYITDMNHKLVMVNNRFEQLLGGKQRQLIGMKLTELFPEAVAKMLIDNNNEVLQQKIALQFEETLPMHEATHTYVSNKAPLFDDLGNLSGICGVSTDITDRKADEIRLKNLLDEKDLLLQEVNHRVKNNLQVISSLLHLQARSVRDPQALALLSESGDRVRSMALIHENLYRTHLGAGVDLPAYLKSLMEQLMETYDMSGKIHFDFVSDPVSLDLNRAIPLGLICNELLSNSLKHAFKPGDHGKVTVRLKQDASMIRLDVSDNGPGLPESTDIPSANSLGLKLVNLLVNQIHGTMDLDRSTPGFHISISIEPAPQAITTQGGHTF